MRLLFATPYPPSLLKPRPYHFIRELAARGHRVHLLISLATPAQAASLPDLTGWAELVQACESIDHVIVSPARSLAQCVRSLLTPTPLRVAFCRSPEMARKAESLIERWNIDLLHVDRERLAPLFNAIEIPKVLDATDSITLYLRDLIRYGAPHERLVSLEELPKMIRFERTMADGYSACLVTGDRDAQALRATGARYRIESLANGVQASPFDDRQPRHDRLVFIGNMSYGPNVDAARWFVRRVLPRIHEVRPQVQVTLVGNRPNRSVKRLARKGLIEVTGRVPSVAPYLSEATLFVAPLRIGGGFPNKVAEALAAGVPTVATPAGFEGVTGLTPGKHLLAASSPAEFARHVLSLLENQSERHRLAREGREFILDRFQWPDIAARLEAIYREALTGHVVKLDDARQERTVVLREAFQKGPR